MRETIHDDYVPKINYSVFIKCQPEWRLHPDSVTHHEITYIIKGKARYTIDGNNYELGGGDLLYLNDGMEKEAITYSNNLMHCYSVNFCTLFQPKNTPPPPPNFLWLTTLVLSAI
jgi:hypothetical protein